MGFAPVLKKSTCSRKKGLAKKKMTPWLAKGNEWLDTN
jgi:hypothetical protein